MTTQTTQLATDNAASAPLAAACSECDARIAASVALPGEILDCPDCGAELEVRSVSPLVLALAPQVEEDWGE
jgi:alpha-aminoadipate carrier protein LysW